MVNTFNKKIILYAGVALVLAASLIIAPYVLADNSTGPTEVRGNVYNVTPSGVVNLSGLNVQVTCNSNHKKMFKSAVTDASGLYMVNFNGKRCDLNDNVSSKTTYNSETVKVTVKVSSQSTATLDIYF